MNYSQYFNNTIIVGKFFILIFMLVLSFVNGYTTYINRNPQGFLGDNIAVGLSSALAIAFIAYMRGRRDLIPSMIFVTFMLFFVFNVLREISGINAINEDDTATDTEKKEKEILTWPAVGLAILSVLVLGGLAFFARVPYPFKRLFIESVVFAGLCATAEGVVASNHNKSTNEILQTVGVNFVLFFIINLILQYGGLYRRIFQQV